MPESAAVFNNHSLFVPEVRASDLGVYTCQVTAGSLRETREAEVIQACE